MSPGSTPARGFYCGCINTDNQIHRHIAPNYKFWTRNVGRSPYVYAQSHAQSISACWFPPCCILNTSIGAPCHSFCHWDILENWPSWPGAVSPMVPPEETGYIPSSPQSDTISSQTSKKDPFLGSVALCHLSANVLRAKAVCIRQMLGKRQLCVYHF